MPITLTRRGWAFVLGAGVLSVIGYFVGLRDLWYLVAFIAAVPVLGLVTVTLLRLLVRVETRVIVADPTPSAGESVPLFATLRNPVPFALDARVTWGLGAKTQEVDTALAARQVTRLSHEWWARKRGPAVVGVDRLVILDPLGVATARLRLRDGAPVTQALVLPRLLQLASETGELETPELDAYAQATHTHKPGEPGNAVREYQPGDARRSIHWKQSARQGELLVRLDDPADRSIRCIELVTDAAAYGDAAADTDAVFEREVSRVATRATQWIRAGHTVQLVIDGSIAAESASEGDLLRHLALVELSR